MERAKFPGLTIAYPNILSGLTNISQKMGSTSPNGILSTDISPCPKIAWVTLVTKASYLPGFVLLAYSLKKHNSKYPLIVLTTASLPDALIPSLEEECSLSNSIHLRVSSLAPPSQNLPPSLIAARFADTWTKLRVFELHRHGCEKLVFLDADMLVRRNMDELFDVPLPKNWLAANHVCVCNLDSDSWAPAFWTKDNCAYTGLVPGSKPTPVPNEREGKETHTLLNSGMFIFTPFQEQWEAILRFLATDERVRGYLFPDQDFLADLFRGRWKSLGWEYNALKTMRYWHPDMWEDVEVRNLHYIVDKPWNGRVGEDGVAGYLGRDGVTHQWWWHEFASWEKERESMGRKSILEMVRKEVAAPLGS